MTRRSSLPSFLSLWRLAVKEAALAPSTKLVCLNLSQSFRDGGVDRTPNLDRQSQETGLSVKTIEACLGQACDAGFLVEDRLTGGRDRVFLPVFPGAGTSPRSFDGSGFSSPDV